MSKKDEKEQVVAGVNSESLDHELYYHIEHLEMSGTFKNCTIIINAGKPEEPPVTPPGGQ